MLNVENGNMVVTENKNQLDIGSLEKKLELISNTSGAEAAMQTILIYILEGNKNSLNDALSAFYKYGDQVAHIFKGFGVSAILKDIYNNFNTQLNDKVAGVVGVTDTNTYLFDFLGEKLPELYTGGAIPTRPIDDMMNQNGILSVLIGELADNKKKTLEQINNLFIVKRQVNGTEYSESDNHEKYVRDKYMESFEENMKKVTKIFENSDVDYLFAVIKEMGNVIGDKDNRLVPVAKTLGLPENWTDNMSYLLGSLVEGQKDGGELLRDIYEMLKSGNHLPNASSEDAIDAELVEDLKKDLKSVIETTLKEMLEDTSSPEDDPTEKLEDIAKQLESLGDIKDIKALLLEMKNTSEALPECSEGSSLAEEDLKIILNAIESSKDSAQNGGQSSSMMLMLKSIQENLADRPSGAAQIDPGLKEITEELKEQMKSGKQILDAVEALDKKINSSLSESVQEGGPGISAEYLSELKMSILSGVSKAKDEIKEHISSIASGEYDEGEEGEEEGAEESAPSAEFQELKDEIANLGSKFDRIESMLAGMIKTMDSEIGESKKVREQVMNEFSKNQTPSKNARADKKSKEKGPIEDDFNGDNNDFSGEQSDIDDDV